MSLAENRPARIAGDVAPVWLPVIFTFTIFLSATLLFFVQPLFAKLILPRIGGAPAVWTTAMLFFQTVLIAGYVYAHLLVRYLAPRGQLLVHMAFWALALTFLPLAVSEDWAYDATRSTALQTLVLLAGGVGVPFAMLSANAPLVQAWYARSRGPSSADPYFLYGASNLGSLLALLAFPFLAEPFFGLGQTVFVWTAGFVVLGISLGICGYLVRSGRQAAPVVQAKVPMPITRRQIATWLAIAFVPSTLMLSVTTEISTDLGAFPLIWVLPLALYILSFVVTFTVRGVPKRVTRPAALISICLMAFLVSNHANGMGSLTKAVLFAPALFALAVEAHRMLYARRPEAGHLTVFYITMSVGGALGGLANSILAPWLLSDVHELTISVLAAAGLLLMGTGAPDMRALTRSLLAGISVIALVFAWSDALIVPLPEAVVIALAVLLAGVAGLVWRQPLVILAGITIFLALDGAALNQSYLFKDRSFFGAHKVIEQDDVRVYVNGTTLHGQQFIVESGRPEPLSYYHRLGPMAEVMTGPAGRAASRVGIMGLGVGSLACYARPGQSWEFYEIDAMVDQVARDPSLFTFVSECAPDAPTHLGDARVVLEGQDRRFDILVLDAYSSDAIPVHLATREAVEMYRDRLAEDGTLMFHISNRYYDIRQPLARIGAELGLTMAIRDHVPDRSRPEYRRGKPSSVLIMSPDPARIEAITRNSDWTPLLSDGGAVWTDDFSNLLSALKWFQDR